MTIFYNPRKRKPRLWIFLVFISIPILVLAIVWLGTRKNVEQYELQKIEDEKRDVFDKF